MVMRLERWLYAKNIGRKLYIGTSEQLADEVFFEWTEVAQRFCRLLQWNRETEAKNVWEINYLSPLGWSTLCVWNKPYDSCWECIVFEFAFSQF